MHISNSNQVERPVNLASTSRQPKLSCHVMVQSKYEEISTNSLCMLNKTKEIEIYLEW